MKGLMAGSGPRLLLFAAALLAIFLFKGVLIEPRVGGADTDFNTERAFDRLSRILGDQTPHPVDSAAEDVVRARLIDEIRLIGFEPELRDDFACRASRRWGAVSCARVRNMVFMAGPQNGGAILVAAHYDSVAAGPGAADDGAGVAALLEIAAILKDRQPVKPVVFLITDGEEQGLIGAHSFARGDPLAKKIVAVVNMEARGAKGPAIMFETSSPNSRDVVAYSNRAFSPVGNSLAADIYKRMPNDTDMSEFLPLRPDGVNLAFTERLPLYHTPLDNLSNLDMKSLAHLGESALAALDGFLRDIDHTAKEEERSVVFADVFGRFMIVAPALAALAMILAGLIASIATFVRASGEQPIRTALAPVFAMIVAGVIAFCGLWTIGALRDASSYWYATPVWTRAFIYLSAVAAGVGAMALAANSDRRRLIAAAWFWFSVLGLAAYALAPGSGMIFGLPAVLFGCAALASSGAQRLLGPISLLAVVAALSLWAPAFHHAETGLGLGSSWPFAIPAALLFMVGAPIATPAGRVASAYGLTVIAAWFAAGMMALTASAYSPSAPRPLNIQHIVEAGSNEAFFAISPTGEQPPPLMSKALAFEKRKFAGLSRTYFAASAPAHDGAAVSVSISANEVREQGRRVSLEFSSNGADEIIVIAPKEAGLSLVGAGGEEAAFDNSGSKIIRCVGRACADFKTEVDVGADVSPWTVIGVRYGLDDAGAAAAGLRPSWTVPIQGGDTRLVISEISI